MLEQNLICLAVLDANVERNVASHFGCQHGITGHGVARDAKAINERDAVVGLKGRIAFGLTITGITPLYLTIVTVAVDDVGSLHLQDSDEHQQE